MKQRIKTLFASGVLACALFGAAAAGPFEDGTAAFKRGDYGVAVSLWRPLAEQGNAVAERNLGTMYHGGLGVPQDDGQAAAWFRIAADQGDGESQHMLAAMYYEGVGVPQDYVLAHAWVNLALSRALFDRGMAIRMRDELTTKMTPDQIAEAQRMAREWKPTKAAPPQ